MYQNANRNSSLKTIGLQVLLAGLLLLNISCGTKEIQLNSDHKVAPPDLELPDDTHFDIQFQIKQVGDQSYYLTTALELDEGSYVISPFSEDTFYLKFNIFLEENEFFTLNDPLIEVPPSIIEFDTIIETPVRFVRQNTIYKQPIKINQQEDFNTTGMVELLVEPSCIPYQVDFTLSYQSGALNIQKTETRFHPSYKGR